MIHATHRRVVRMLNAVMESAHAWQNIMAMRIPAADLNAFSITIVTAIRLALIVSAPIPALVFAHRTPFAKCSITSRCAVALMEWKEMHLSNANHSVGIFKYNAI